MLVHCKPIKGYHVFIGASETNKIWARNKKEATKFIEDAKQYGINCTLKKIH